MALKTISAANEVHGYARLQQQIHDALRAQHPEWVQLNGDSPTCDAYESRFADLLRVLPRRELMTKNAARIAISAVRLPTTVDNFLGIANVNRAHQLPK